MPKKALITGITGQEGSYYQEPHESHLRRHLIYGDLNDASSLNQSTPGWEPKVKFRELVRMMMDADVATLRKKQIGASADTGK